MKKFLLAAGVVSALGAGEVAQANYNYAGLGLGWVVSRASTSQNVGAMPQDIDNTIVKPRAKDNSFAGKVFVGHAFGSESFAWLIDAGIALDGTATKAKANASWTQDGDTVSGTVTTSLRRRGVFSLGVGASGKIAKDIALYGKVSLLAGQFRMSTTSAYTGESAPGVIDTASLHAPNFKKSQWKWGAGLTFGASKQMTDVLSVGIDYTFELFQKIKLKKSNPKLDVATGPVTYNGSMKPVYHTVMLSVTRKF